MNSFNKKFLYYENKLSELEKWYINNQLLNTYLINSKGS